VKPSGSSSGPAWSKPAADRTSDVLHGIFGTATIVPGFLTGAGGLITTKARANRKQLRTFHLWVGRLAVVLSLLTVLAGLPQAGIF
jgi:hypothetical protein